MPVHSRELIVHPTISLKGGIGSGINNAVNCDNPIVPQLILESLHYLLLTEFHIDGFSFVNASHLLRGSSGDNLPCPLLV